MDRSEVLTLISYSYSKDSKGITVKEEIRNDVFVNVSSASRDEWYKGNRVGINPSYRFTMFAYDYSEQDTCEFKGQTYSIYRTYITDNDQIELYVKKVSGK